MLAINSQCDFGPFCPAIQCFSSNLTLASNSRILQNNSRTVPILDRLYLKFTRIKLGTVSIYSKRSRQKYSLGSFKSQSVYLCFIMSLISNGNTAILRTHKRHLRRRTRINRQGDHPSNSKTLYI